jgi:hypothetical protein
MKKLLSFLKKLFGFNKKKTELKELIKEEPKKETPTWENPMPFQHKEEIQEKKDILIDTIVNNSLKSELEVVQSDEIEIKDRLISEVIETKTE